MLNTISNPAEAHDFYIQLINSANKEIMILLPVMVEEERGEMIRTIVHSLQEAEKRGVHVRAITHAINNKLQVENLNIRSLNNERHSEIPEMLIVDRQTWFEYRAGPGKDITSIYSADPSTVRSFVALFDNFWEQTMLYGKLKETSRLKDDYIQKQRKLYDKLREADRLKDEFINIAAHELRTPIMPIIGSLELIESKLGSVDSSIRDELSIISRNAERLLKLSEDILQASRIETGRLKLYIEQVNLNVLIAEVITDMEKKYQQSVKLSSVEKADLHSLIMHVIGERSNSGSRKIMIFDPSDAPLIIECDRNKIGEVLFNLLDNAIKFIDERDGSIYISARLSGPNVIVSIMDNGAGIDPSIKDRMFDKFTTRSEKGSGLGLFIAKSIVEAHGGQIWAGNNSNGKGATFAFSLPIRFLRSETTVISDQQLPQITTNQKTVDQMRRDAIDKIETMKTSLLDAREEALKKRNDALERYQKKVEESRNLIRARQDFINQQISYKRMRREVDSRIEKGLEGLQRLIDGLRENILGDETIEKIGLHPTVYDAIRYEASKVIESEFFQSIKIQLAAEGAGEAEASV